jgi:hypothetical protein
VKEVNVLLTVEKVCMLMLQESADLVTLTVKTVMVPENVNV